MQVRLQVVLLGLASAACASVFEKRDALADCLSQSGVPTDGLGTSGWAMDVAPFNLQLNYTPIGIAVPTTTKHVQDAVACAVKLGVKANPKCGGHSYASFGLGGEDGHLVIEMDVMNAVVVDNSTFVADIQGGARLGHVALQLYNQGGRGISHGTCPGVGIGGHVLHGGFGVSSHTKGLSLDWIVGATVVLANSTVVNCSATEHPDLFWALRGAGSSMGIVTSIKFNTFKVPDTVTYYTAAMVWPTQAKAVAGLQAVQDFAQNMPLELNMRIFITGHFTNLEGLYYGNKTQLQSTLQPLLNKTGGSLQLAQQGGWMDQLNYFGNGIALDQGHPYNYHETFYSSSLYTRALKSTQLQSFVNYWFTVAKPNKRDWYVQIDMHGGNTSAVTVPAVDSSAYMHRDFLLMYAFYDKVDSGPYPADGYLLMDNFVTNITNGMGETERGMYVNYPDPRMNQSAAQARYWGSHLDRLQSIKKAVDPQNLFYYPQGIMPSG